LSPKVYRYQCLHIYIYIHIYIGVEFATKSIQVDQKTIKAQIWDTAGNLYVHVYVYMYIYILICMY
jgi:GTPase SAR1 family protein